MKKFLFSLSIVLLLASIVWASTWTSIVNDKSYDSIVYQQTFTGNDASEDVPLNNVFLKQVEVFGQDDAVTIVISSDLGSPLYSDTTSTAVTGDVVVPSSPPFITGSSTMALSDVSTGSMTTIRFIGTSR